MSLASAADTEMRANLRKAIGPGILVACAAVGGSHLVWSTRAGAEYGWRLVGVILLANLLKYPFFLYGHRYTAATGESLLEGYRRQGRFALWLFFAINVLTGIINIAGVALITAALLDGYGWIPGDLTGQTLGILLMCALLLFFGHYRVLDGLSKGVMLVLALSTFAAVLLAWGRGAPPRAPDFVPRSPWRWEAVPFLVFLLGWMPAPVDLSAWSSLWIFSRGRQTGHFATPRETAVDFYLGYVMTALLAVAFVALGRLIMYGTGMAFSESGVAFSKQLVHLYAASIGAWSRLLILTAAFLTMFSTTLTCMDGYPRALAACTRMAWPRADYRRLQQGWMVLCALGAVWIVKFAAKSLMQHLSFAAAVSFLTSPFLAAINFKIMYGANVPPDQRPGRWLAGISWAGLIGFAAMSAGYIYVQFYR